MAGIQGKALVMEYVIVLAASWLVNGSIKYAVNLIRHGKANALHLVGYGGFPSTHTAVITAQLVYVGLRYGFHDPAIAALLALLWVVVNDATNLRKKIQDHAMHLNALDNSKHHRERIAHKAIDIIGGIVVGAVVAYGCYMF
jgi:uncharacterized protein